MGNTLPNQQQQSIKNALQKNKRNNHSISIENTIRYQSNRNSNDGKSTIQFGRNVQKEHKCRSLNNKSKQKLSLSKEHHSQSQIKLKPNRTASNDFQNHTFNTRPYLSHNHHQSQVQLTRPFVRFINTESEQKIKKVALRPRDLPRKFSTQKVIIYHPPQRVPLQPRIIINPPIVSSPCIHINYATKHQKNKSQHSMQSSIVTPFVPLTPSHQYLHLQGKKLKKVPLNRSYVNNSIGLLQNNVQQFQVNKQNQKISTKAKGQIKSQPRIQGQDKQQFLFTDPTLYSYITNKPHPCANDIKTKYALPVDQSNINPKNIKKVTSPIKIYNKLEEAITEQVQSKALIESESYRFPTFTDVSQGSHTDNTSFVPIIRNNSSKDQHMHGEQLLNYCRPRIDERVYADLQKLKCNN